MRRSLYLALLTTVLLSCGGKVVVPAVTICTVKGTLSRGGICAHSNNDETNELTLPQLIDMLEARPERPDPDHPGQVLPMHAAAIIESAEDWGAAKLALDIACRELNDKCVYAIQLVLKRINDRIDSLKASAAR